MILILSNKWDITVDFIVKELNEHRHEFLRLNTEDLQSWNTSISPHEFRIRLSNSLHHFDLSERVRVIWNRRPGRIFDFIPRNERPSLASQEYINNQWFSWLETLQLIEEVRWVNDPRFNAQIENKIRQLRTAANLGFRIPNTLITNDPDEARDFARSNGDLIIAKALYSPLIEEPEEDFFIFTNEVSSREIYRDNEVRVTPTIFQERLYPKNDYRVTVVGEKVFAAKVEITHSTPRQIDWRMIKENLKFQLTKLPSDIENLCRDYVRANGLLFGAIDLVEHNGQFYFLEINPNGEWGWLQKPNNIPIAETLTDLLISLDEES